MWIAGVFKDIKEDVLTISFDYADFEDFWNSFENGDGPMRQCIGDLPQEARGALIEKLQVAFLNRAQDGLRSSLAGVLACRGAVPTI